MSKLLWSGMVLLIIATLVLPAGCSGETAELKAKRYLELLNLIPANEETLQRAYVQDGAYLAEKIEQYPQVTDKYAIAYSHHLSGLGHHYDEEEWQKTLGFALGDVDKTVLAGTEVHFTNYQAVHVIVDQDTVINAVKTGPLNDILEIADYHGVEYYSWGEDNEIDLRRMSLVRPLGIGYRLAYIDGFIFWASWTDGIKEMIDSYEGNITSLADNEDYKLLAGALEELDTVTAFFSTESQSFSYISEFYQQIIEDPGDTIRRQVFVEEIQREPRLKPYQALATGAGIDDRGYYLVIVLLNPSEEVAQENATLLEQRISQSKIVTGYSESGVKWSDLIENIEIESQGRLTLAKLYGGVVEYWASFDVWASYEPLLVYE